jgi:DNA primase
MGNHLNARQFRELCDFGGTVYLAFDSDVNQSGQQAAQRISACLASRGVTVRRIQLPNGHDPNSFFVQGIGDTQQFHRLLEEAHV